MKSKVSVIIGSIFAAYVAFVAVVVLVYEPTPDDMSWEDRQSYNSQKMNELALGQNIVSVKQLLGKADFSEAKAVKETKLQVLFYRTHHEKSDGVTTKEECTPLIFENDQCQIQFPSKLLIEQLDGHQREFLVRNSIQ